MSEKFQPGEEAFEDTEGHGYSSGRILPESDDQNDVDGHGAVRIKAMPQESEDDTEGHGTLRGSFVADRDDVEGHRIYATSDRSIKHDVAPVVSEEEPHHDTEGRATRVES